jgi:hypothetical protein
MKTPLFCLSLVGLLVQRRMVAPRLDIDFANWTWVSMVNVVPKNGTITGYWYRNERQGWQPVTDEWTLNTWCVPYYNPFLGVRVQVTATSGMPSARRAARGCTQDGADQMRHPTASRQRRRLDDRRLRQRAHLGPAGRS